MDKAQMDETNELMNYPGAYDKCKCGNNRNDHMDQEGTRFLKHTFVAEEQPSKTVTLVLKTHKFVNVAGTALCGDCGLDKDHYNHEPASGTETYRKPIYYRFDLIPPIALRRLAAIYDEGARVYGNSKYISKPMPHSNVVNHLQNHFNLACSGDTTEDHWAKIAWAAFTMIVYEELDIGEADLTKYGVLPKINPDDK